MQSRSVSDCARAVAPRLLPAIACAVAAATFCAAASADDAKQACSKAYDDTQLLRSQGKLKDARVQAAACARDTCAAFIRSDCGKWVDELTTAQPTVVVRARDARGHDASAVRVTIDGAAWLEQLDGRAQPLDPGSHTLRFELAGELPVVQTIVVREGEKDRTIDVAFGAAAPVAPAAPLAAATPAAAADSAPSASIAPWILGGAGVVLLATGGALTGALLAEKSALKQDCGGTGDTWCARGASAASTGQTLGPITTTAFIAGGAAVGVAAVWLLVRKPPAAATTTGGLRVDVGASSVAIGGAW
ncbi:MAG TPA: hypothetical protein VGM56_15005 [Byssovorax sp.]|jgi:hypothetical protein